MKHASLLFLLALAPALAAARPPNVLLILADDMGFSDAGCYGGEIATPNLEKLAADGLRFTQFYNTARCWPTRASILSGYYPQQVRRDAIPGVPKTGSNGVRPAWARLLPEMLKPLGYRSYHSGKWHVDGPRLKAGFDRSYSIEDHDRHFAPQATFEDDVKLPPVKAGSGYYSATAIADHAIKYLKEHAERHGDAPFFTYLAFISPHFPLHAPPDDVARYTGTYDVGWDLMRKARHDRQHASGLLDCALPEREPAVWPDWNLAEGDLQRRIGRGEVGRALAWDDLTAEQRTFQAAKMSVHAAMVDRMDREIGRVLAQLDAMGVADDTIVLFCSDNGASGEQIIRGGGHDPAAPVGSGATFLGLGPGWSTAANAPFRLHKSWVHEGGIATPLIVRWPKGIKDRGAVRRKPVGHVIDVPPTILELAGGRWPENWGEVAVPPPPGKSLVPALSAEVPIPRDDLWWFHEDNRAIRVGDWKLVSAGKDGPWELYDLAADRSETTNLAAAQPARVKEMAERWARRMREFKALATKEVSAPARL